MSRATLPNLKFLEHQAKAAIRSDEDAVNKIVKHRELRVPAAFERKCIQIVMLEAEELSYKIPAEWVELTCDVFLQAWGSTCTAFDVMPDGSAAVGGCAMTDAYTVVFHEHVSDTYVVFVDNELCYMVQNPTDAFLEDLKNRNLRSLSEAERRY